MEVTRVRNQNNCYKYNAPSFKARGISAADSFIKETKTSILAQIEEAAKAYKPLSFLNMADKKPLEVEYLRDLASKKDKFGYYRIPPDEISYFSQLSIEEMEKYKPILLSKNDMGLWNFESDIIDKLKTMDDKNLSNLSKLLNAHVQAENALYTIKIPWINMEKTIEKAESLNKLYGDNLREIAFFTNSRFENYLTAHIQLPHRSNKPDWQNFKQVFAKLDTDVNPVQRLNSKSQIDNLVGSVYKKLQSKLCVFTENELNQAISNIKLEVPKATEQEILSVMQRLTQFASYSSLGKIGKKLQKENIGSIHDDGNLNKCFEYFHATKRILHLKPAHSNKEAYLVTRKDIENPLEISIIKDAIEFDESKFINLEGWSDAVNLLADDKKLEKLTKTVLQKAKQIAAENSELTFDECIGVVLNKQITEKMKELGIDIKTIRLAAPATKSQILEQMKPIMPTESLIKSTIESIANHYTDDKKSFVDLCQRIAKYYDENINAYSKQSIIENLKALNTKIKEFQLQHNISDENVRYVMPRIPCKHKSFELISEMFKDLYSLPNGKVRYIHDMININQHPANSAFVLLDDVIASGDSMLKAGQYSFQAGKISNSQHIIFAPITASQRGIDAIKNCIQKAGRYNNDTVLYLEENVKDYAQTKNIFTELDTSAQKYAEQIFGKEGHSKDGMCTVFPYMDPDNNSSLAGYLTKFFVPDSNCLKSRTTLVPVIEQKTYCYDIFGTDKEHILTDPNKVFPTESQNPVVRFVKSLFIK